MPNFFWYQRQGGEDAWRVASAPLRQQVISETKPAFVTVLDAHEVPDDEAWGREEYDKLRYKGPLYFDFDAESCEEAIQAFQKLLANLEENGVDLESLRLYATGGRGFHCEVPEEVFIVKPAKTGYAMLPYVYREMAMELAVETMDMRVYTGRKGRMWRVAGVQRANGKYKVPVTVDQVLRMTPELYDELCSVPRLEPVRATPKHNMFLGTLFDKAKSVVDRQVKSRGKGRKDVELLKKFSGEFPPTLVKLMAGIGVAPGKGFHQIAMQLAITANALGKTADQLVESCEGLVSSHSSDSPRYNSPRKRKEELRRMWDYTHDTPVYEFSVGGIKSLCDHNVATPDIDGIELPEAGAEVTAFEDLPPEVQAEFTSAQASLMEGVTLTDAGIMRRTEAGHKSICNLVFLHPVKLIDLEDGLSVGMEMTVIADKRNLGRHAAPMQTFKSRSTFSEFCVGRGGIFSGSDTQAGVVYLLLSRLAMKNNDIVHVVRKEGLDFIQNPNVTDRASFDLIWATADEVLVLHKDDPDVPSKYRFAPKLSSSPVFNSDLHKGHTLESTPETQAWFRSLLNMNSPLIVAQMLGWFVSCFHKQFYHQAYNQFPLLHPHGTAGSGKTQTTTLLANLFYVTRAPYMVGCSANATTAFSLKAAWTSSSSIPVILDEYKPSELGPVRYDFLLQHFRLLYNQGNGTSGGMNRGGADSSYRDVSQYSFSAPTVYLGESQEMQTAIVQRTVPVAFNQNDSSEHTPHFAAAAERKDLVSRLGSSLLELSARETRESRKAAIDPHIKRLREILPKGVHERQIYNTAVVLCGLDFLEKTARHVFGDVFDGEFDRLREAMLEHRDEFNVVAMAESSKVLNDMALMSRTEAVDGEFAMREGYEYIVGDGWVELLVKPAFIKYTAWCTRKGMRPLYTAPDAFIGSVAKNAATLDRICFASKLRTSPAAKVLRFNTDVLAAEGVESFLSKSFG